MIYAADCREIDFSACDVMITDPPYRAHVHAAAISQSVGGGTRKRELGFEHLSTDLIGYIADIASKVKRWSCIFSDIESVGMWQTALENAGATYIRAVPWVRWSMPQLSGDRPPQGSEMVVVAYGSGGGRKHWDGPGNLTSLTHTCLRGDGKHKCEKPLDLMLDLVSWFSDEGETVADPCAGSGTTALACRLLNRKWLASEADKEWANKAHKRSKEALSVRDEERYARWRATRVEFLADKERRDTHTAKVRAKLEAAK